MHPVPRISKTSPRSMRTPRYTIGSFNATYFRIDSPPVPVFNAEQYIPCRCIKPATERSKRGGKERGGGGRLVVQVARMSTMTYQEITRPLRQPACSAISCTCRDGSMKESCPTNGLHVVGCLHSETALSWSCVAQRQRLLLCKHCFLRSPIHLPLLLCWRPIAAFAVHA